MAYRPMVGLLGQDESMAPGIGLLNSPAMQALTQRAAGAPAGMEAPQAPNMGAAPPTAPAAAPAPPTTPSPLPATAHASRKSPLGSGVQAAGLSLLMTNDGRHSLSQQIGHSLASGLEAGAAAKAENEQKDLYRDQIAAFRSMLASPEVRAKFKNNPAGLRMVSAMGPGEGVKYLQKMMETGEKTTVVGKSLVRDATGEVVYQDPTKKDDYTLGDTRFDGETNQAVATNRKDDTHDKFVQEELQARGLPTDYDFTRNPGEGRAIIAAAQAKREAAARAGRSTSNTTVNLGGRAFATAVGKVGADVIAASQAEADAAGKDRLLVQQAQAQLKKGIIAGTGANPRVAIAKFLQTAGLTQDDRVENTEIYTATTAARILPIAKTLGSGSGFSDKDREFLTQMQGGNISVTPQALERLLGLQDKANVARIRQHNERIDNLSDADLDGTPRGTLKVTDPITGGMAPTKKIEIDGHSYTARLGDDGDYTVTINGKPMKLSTMQRAQ